MKRDLIVFGEDWGRHPTSTQHIVRRLATDRKVVWINSVGMRRPRVGLRDLKRIGQKIQSMSGKRETSGVPISIPDNMTVIEPKVVPWPGNPLVSLVNRRIGGQALRRQVESAELSDPAIWVSVPTAIDLLPALPDCPVVYYCGDDFGGLAGVDHKPVLACERRLADKARKVFTVSDVLASRFDAAKVVGLPHGADVRMFSSPAERPLDMPDGGKVAGFYGSVSEWLDQDLMTDVATYLSDWTFLFIGDIQCNVSKLANLRNVRFLGPRRHNQLPGYAQHWTVSLLPFLDNDQIRACNPLKLREYMAVGTPIVATPFPALRTYRDHIRIADTADAFAASIQLALSEPTSSQRARSAAVQSESWESRAQMAANVIDRL